MREKATVLGVIVLVAVAAVIGIRFAGMKPHASTPARIPAQLSDSSKWVPVFRDDFSGTSLDTSKWATCYDWRQPADSGCTNGGNFEQEWYMPQQVAVHDGSVFLTAAHTPITVVTNTGPRVYSYRSGMISTGRADTNSPVKWSGTYGYYETRMRFDGGQGVWPAFWLLPTDHSWPPEIDIMELLGNDPNHVLLTTHWKDANGQPQKDGSIIPGPDFTAGWHTYAVNWQPNRIDWYIDGTLKKSVTGQAVPNKPMEIIVNLAIGGILPGNADATTTFPRTAQVDYVKVYELRL